jgi:3'-phosphoadenosine 5'-phosphosulfate sulfotransferase (PAPS reductase)/FAD synthetase
VRVLSLGAGVQSSALFLMACEGIEPVDAAIFSDTGWEPAAVYEWLQVLEAIGAERGGDIRADALTGFASLPLYVEKDGQRLMGQRQCTNQYKLRPIRRRLRELQCGSERVELSLGISLDEIRRMKDADVQWIKHVYPLVDRRMTRGDCITWLQTHGFPVPPKSACVGCA